MNLKKINDSLQGSLVARKPVLDSATLSEADKRELEETGLVVLSERVNMSVNLLDYSNPALKDNLTSDDYLMSAIDEWQGLQDKSAEEWVEELPDKGYGVLTLDIMGCDLKNYETLTEALSSLE